MTAPASTPLHAVHVSFHADQQQRDAAALLSAWPTLPAVAAAALRGGVRTTVVQTAHRDETVLRDGVEFHFIADRSRTRTRVTARVASLAPDVVHVQGFHHALAVRAMSHAGRRAPVMVQDHAAVAPTGVRGRWWRFAFRDIAGAAFTVREQARPWITGGVLRRDLPVFEVLEGSSTFTPGSQRDARAATGLFGDPCLLWTSHLKPNKDPLMMLDSVERAAAQLPGLRLWSCFGEAPMLDVVRSRVNASSVLRDRVSLLGRRPHRELELMQRAADFFIQTSHRESSGYSLLEAMACGTTPIVTDIPAARWIVGDAGSLTPVGDAAAMGTSLVEWACRDRHAMRLAARTRFESSLSFDMIGRQLRAAYESLARARQ